MSERAGRAAMSKPSPVPEQGRAAEAPGRVVGPASDRVAALRRAIAAIERGEDSDGPALPADAGFDGGRDGARHLALGAGEVDAALGGGLALGTLHEAAAEAGGANGAGALAAFGLGLAARAVAKAGKPVLVIQQELAAWEAGALYGPGLDAFGLPAAALVLVRVRRPQDVLFAMEEGLQCSALSAVLGEFATPFPEALTATRRLSLAARGRPVIGLVLHQAADPASSAAFTRWRLSPLASPAPDGLGGLGPPRLRACLVRSRTGAMGTWPLAFADGAFRVARDPLVNREPGHDLRSAAGGLRPALSLPRPAASGHGSPRTADVA